MIKGEDKGKIWKKMGGRFKVHLSPLSTPIYFQLLVRYHVSGHGSYYIKGR